MYGPRAGAVRLNALDREAIARPSDDLAPNEAVGDRANLISSISERDLAALGRPLQELADHGAAALLDNVGDAAIPLRGRESEQGRDIDRDPIAIARAYDLEPLGALARIRDERDRREGVEAAVHGERRPLDI